jgi:hypothetical protein
MNFIEDTKKILEDTQELIKKKERKYYRDVLDFLNLVFENESNNITSIKIQKITINEYVFIIYNAIVKKYQLDVPLIDISKFDADYDYESKEVIELVYNMCNNVLYRLNYKLKKHKDKITQKQKLIIIFNK